MMSLLVPRKTVGFETPSVVPAAGDSDSESDGAEEAPGTILKKALTFTTKHRFKQLIGDAVQLDRRNTLAARDFQEDRQNLKQKRLAKMRGLGKKDQHIPKLAQIVRSANDKPIVKFRRMARAVLLLIQVCHVCKDILSAAVKKEPWFALIDNLIAKSTIQQKRKAPRAFVTFVPNERRELVQLTFDVAEFKRERRTEFVLTDEIRNMMSILPGFRTPPQVAEIIRVMKVLFPTFANYKLHTQKSIGQLAFYDKYKANRVIVKKGHQADGLYFILTGCVVEKHEGGKQPKLINAGEKFGENDLLCGNKRRHTVLTKVDTEIFYLHRQDYRVIFDMSEDSNNPKNLDICRQHIVFQHFPMQRLVENPGTWSVINYKYGQLIAMDGNNIDWIYVIKSGEARVFKYLHSDNVDVRARRRKVQAMINSQSPFYRKKRILNFVEEREYIKSAYRPSVYHPPVGTGRVTAHSAPPASSRRQKTAQGLLPRACVSMPATREGPRQTPSRKTSFARPEKREITLPRLVLDSDAAEGDQDTERKDSQAEDDAGSGRVIQETVVELPQDLTARSQTMQHLGGGGGGDGEPSQDSNPRLLSPDRGSQENISELPEGRGGEQEEEEGGGKELERGGGDDNGRAVPDEPRLGVELTGKRLIERRLSADMTGGLFDRPVVPGQSGRRRSILVPPDEAPVLAAEAAAAAAAAARRQPPAEPAARPRGRLRGRSASFLKTPQPPTARSQSSSGRGDKGQDGQVGRQFLPAFVQVETLHPGQVFGLRACLDPEERGPSVSLVSGDCEVLQINKKFFMRHCDDAIYSLIRLKNKPFPTEEDLIDRLDINMQWDEYKQQTLNNFLKQCRSAKR